MKQLLGGVAMVAVLAISAPVWAQQNPNTPPATQPPVELRASLAARPCARCACLALAPPPLFLLGPRLLGSGLVAVDGLERQLAGAADERADGTAAGPAGLLRLSIRLQLRLVGSAG